jgi:hypothetical protein
LRRRGGDSRTSACKQADQYKKKTSPIRSFPHFFLQYYQGG